MGQATIKVVKVVELLKRVLSGIHISVDIINVKGEEIFKPLYEGLVEIKTEIILPGLKASFSFNSSKVSSLIGYQKI